MDPDNYLIEPLTSADQSFLWDMLYVAIYVPPGRKPYPRSILSEPALSQCVEHWGSKHDDAGYKIIDKKKNKNIAAVWLRLFDAENKGFGYIDDQTPELGIAVLEGYRGQGLGTRLLEHLISFCRGRYKAISLSVSKGNPAIHLYERCGFKAVYETEDSITMQRKILT